MANLVAFLEDENYDAQAKEKLILTLSKKDRRDVNIEILKEALDLTKDFTYEDEDMFYKYVVCPRAYYEPMCKSR